MRKRLCCAGQAIPPQIKCSASSRSNPEILSLREPALEAVVAVAPNPAALNLLGVAAQRMGDAAAARAAFARAGELGLVEGWRNLAVTEKGEARAEAYRRALALAPNDVASHAGLAQALEARHDLAGAKAHAATALRGDPANVTARLAWRAC